MSIVSKELQVIAESSLRKAIWVEGNIHGIQMAINVGDANNTRLEMAQIGLKTLQELLIGLPSTNKKSDILMVIDCVLSKYKDIKDGLQKLDFEGMSKNKVAMMSVMQGLLIELYEDICLLENIRPNFATTNTRENFLNRFKGRDKLQLVNETGFGANQLFESSYNREKFREQVCRELMAKNPNLYITPGYTATAGRIKANSYGSQMRPDMRIFALEIESVHVGKKLSLVDMSEKRTVDREGRFIWFVVCKDMSRISHFALAEEIRINGGSNV